MEQRLAVARAVARRTLGKRGSGLTDEVVEREAALIANGPYASLLTRRARLP